MLFNKKAKANEEQKKSVGSGPNESMRDEKRTLYFIVDKNIPGLLEYVHDCGLSVANVFTSVEMARSALLTQFEPTRAVIIDSGTGLFVTPNIRKDIIDMIGMANQETQFTVFYSDSIIKTSGKTMLGSLVKKEYIEYIPFVSMAVCVAVMLSHSEKYECSKSGIEHKEVKRSLDMVGEKVDVAEGKMDKTARNEVDANFYDRMEQSQSESLMGFVVKL